MSKKLARPWQQPAPLSILPTRPLRIWALTIRIRRASIIFVNISTKILLEECFLLHILTLSPPLADALHHVDLLGDRSLHQKRQPWARSRALGTKNYDCDDTVVIVVVGGGVNGGGFVVVGVDDDLVYKLREGGSTRTPEFRGPWSFRLCHVSLPPGTKSLKNYIAVFKKMKKYGGL